MRIRKKKGWHWKKKVFSIVVCKHKCTCLPMHVHCNARIIIYITKGNHNHSSIISCLVGVVSPVLVAGVVKVVLLIWNISCKLLVSQLPGSQARRPPVAEAKRQNQGWRRWRCSNAVWCQHVSLWMMYVVCSRRLVGSVVKNDSRSKATRGPEHIQGKSAGAWVSFSISISMKNK